MTVKLPKADAEVPGAPVTVGTAVDAAPNQLLKFAIEFGPLLVFFVGNAQFGIMKATAAFMVATIAAIVASRVLLGQVPKVLLVSAGFVMAFGALTLWLNNETFIKIKPTIINAVFSAILFGGLFFDKMLLRHVFGAAFQMTDVGWRKLTVRWALFFACMALLNEAVWRTCATDTWVSFKVFGILPLTFAFAVAQVPLIQRYAANAEPEV